MRPREMMLLGVASAVVASLMIFSGHDFGQASAMLFAGGCVFGKGYGVWEERTSRRNALDKERG